MASTETGLVSVEQAALRLGLAAERVWGLAGTGQLRSVPGTWPPLFRDQEVEAFAGRMAYEAARRPGDSPRGPSSSLKPSPRPRTQEGKEALTFTSAAELLGVSQQTLRAFVASGELNTVGAPPRIRRRDIDAFIEGHRIKPGDLSHMDPNAHRRAGKQDPPLTRVGLPDRRYGRR